MGSKETIDLFCGWPNPSLLPVAALHRASSTVLSTPQVYIPGLLYGPDDGYPPLRKHIAKWLTSFYRPSRGNDISPDRITITGGASQNLACALQVFSDPMYTRHVWMVEPTYHLVARIVDDSGFAGRLRGIPEDEEGVDVGFLERELERVERERVGDEMLKPPRPWRKLYKHVVYCVPSFSNPSGRVMSLQRRERLVQLARRYDALIIADDVYDFLQWRSNPASTLPQPSQAYMPRLVDVDGYLDGGPVDEWGHTLSNGSFSKMVGPGTRTGWAEGMPRLAWGLSQVGSSRSGGAPSHLTATFIDQLLATDAVQQHIRHVLQPAYAARYHRTMSAIREHLLPWGVTLPSRVEDIAGGYFIWIRLPAPLLANEVAERAQQEGLTVPSGEKFQVPGDLTPGRNRFERDIRICFAWEAENRLDEGIRRLGHVIRHS